MELLLPQIGLFFWTLVIFLLLFWVLAKFAWPAILTSLKEREENIAEKLRMAEDAEKKMQELTAGNEKLLIEAREERTQMLKEANDLKDKIVKEAKDTAAIEADRIILNAKAQIEREKNNALAVIKEQAVSLSIEIAEKVLRRELADKQGQEAFAKGLVKDINLN